MSVLDELESLDPWEWRADAARYLREVLADRQRHDTDRERAVLLVPGCTSPDEALVDALIEVLENVDEDEALRHATARALGDLLEQAEWEDFDAPEPGLHPGDDWLPWVAVERMQRSVRSLYRDGSALASLRRAALEAACRSPEDWQHAAVSAAFASEDRDWRLSAVSCMQHLGGHDDEILEAVESADPELRRRALIAAGEQEVEEAWPHVQAVLDDPDAAPTLLAAALWAGAHLEPSATQEHIDHWRASGDAFLAGAAAEAMEVIFLHHVPFELDGLELDGLDGWEPDDDDAFETFDMERGSGGPKPVEVDAPDERKRGSNALIRNLPDRRGMESLLSVLGGRPKDRKLATAQDLMYEAFDEPDPESRLAMAREALKISEDCADAWVLIAEEGCETARERARAFAMAVRAGESALGPEFFEENAGHFWGLLEARPYMRARFGLAQSLHAAGLRGEALGHYRELLRLNPDDNQGVRLLLLDALLEERLDEEAGELLARFDDDILAGMAYGAALLAYRAEGDSEKAREALRAAVEQNAHVPSYLTGKRRIPKNLPPYMSPGDETEAASVAIGQRKAWLDTQGALPWLQERTGKKKKRRR